MMATDRDESSHAPGPQEQDLSRRTLLKSAIGAAAGAVVLPGSLHAALRQMAAAESDATTPAAADLAPAGPRERLLFDGDWRFHLGNADEPSRDFGFGRSRMYAKA